MEKKQNKSCTLNLHETETINMSSCQSGLTTHTLSEECWCSTVQFHETEYTWKINNFNVQLQKGETITSPTFSAASNDNFKWYLALDPKGENGKEDTICDLYLYLSKSSTRKRAFAKFGFSFLSNDSRRQNNFIGTFMCHEFNNDSVESLGSDGDGRGWANFLKIDDTSKNEFLQNDELTITFRLAFFEMNNKSIEEIFCRCNLAHFDHLSKIYSSAFENRDFTDFTISVEGRDYPVHKIILASCSGYFAKMFKSGMKGSSENRVEITGVGKAVMGEVLRFIYTGKCVNYSSNDLLAAADKFEVVNLKAICEYSVCKSLSVDDAFNVMILADRHSANELKLKAIEFFIDNMFEIMPSPGRYAISSKHPRLLSDTIGCLAGKLKTRKLAMSAST